MRARWSLVLGLLLVLACKNGDPLSEEDVTQIPPGDAMGNEHSGSYDIVLTTTSCSGSCGPFSTELFSVTFCEEGDEDSSGAIVTQNDGDLTVVTDSFQVAQLEGGIDQNGDYDVGGVGSDQDGAIEVLARSTGTFASDGFSGTAESRAVGDFNDDRVNCTARYDVTGSRR